MLSTQQKIVAAEVAALLHAKKVFDAAARVADFSKIKVKFRLSDDPNKAAHPILLTWLHTLMNAGAMGEAAQTLWTPNQFNPNPQSVKQVWDLFDTSNQGLIMGGGRLGKSFSMGVRMFLEWARDPEYTGIRVVGPSEDHLESNLFSHLVSLHSSASLPMPGECGDLFIGRSRRDQLSAILGVVVPKGNNKKAGRLQGGHRRPRAVPHPIFGKLSRLFLFVDEVENVPGGIWFDVDNVLSEIEEGGGFKIFMAWNPSDLANKVATQAEPPFGWNALIADEHYRWKSKRGWDVIRLDGERCENVVENRIVYPGLQTREGLEAIAAAAGGKQGAGYLTMGRGMYPAQGMEAVVVPAGMWPKWRGEYIWLDAPEPIGGCDLALDGGDGCLFSIGSAGMATGIKYPMSIDFPEGRTVMFKNRSGESISRMGVQLNLQMTISKGETMHTKNQVLDVCRKAGIRPEFFACDRTGHGAGVADLLKYEWSSIIYDINYSESSSDTKLMLEDSKICKDQYERIYSELWFALRMFGEFAYLLINPSLDLSKLTPQITNRRFRMLNGKSRVESKKDYKSRGFESPGEADSLTLMLHAARRGLGLIPSMRTNSVLTNQDGGGYSNEFDDWPGQYQNGRIDESNRTEILDSSERSGNDGRNGPGWDIL